jgi:hypothetical protein
LREGSRRTDDDEEEEDEPSTCMARNGRTSSFPDELS